MSYYHVAISIKEDPSAREIRFDLSLEQLKARFLAPYGRGTPITIEGKSIPPNEIERIRVYESEHESAHYFPIVEQERQQRRGVLNLTPLSWAVIQKANNVTDDFITGPPGSEAEVPISETLEHRPAPDAREIFVVHGRNSIARDALFDFLTAIDLHPLEWSEVVQLTGKTMPYIGEILDTAFSNAHAVVVLMTPDDEAKLINSLQSGKDLPFEKSLTGQARPNVLFEAGMAMGRHPERTIIVELGDLRPFSDVAGLHVIRLNDTSQRRQELAQRLKTAGCPVNLEGTRWHTVGDFEAAVADLIQPAEESTSPPARQESDAGGPELPDEAVSLLTEASKSSLGMITAIRAARGRYIQVNRRQFGSSDDRRSLAAAEEAFAALLALDLITDQNGQDKYFGITQKGYEFLDSLPHSES